MRLFKITMCSAAFVAVGFLISLLVCKEEQSSSENILFAHYETMLARAGISETSEENCFLLFQLQEW